MRTTSILSASLGLGLVLVASAALWAKRPEGRDPSHVLRLSVPAALPHFVEPEDVRVAMPPPQDKVTRPPGHEPVRQLAIPVEGVIPGDLEDNWGAPRPGGRAHHGIDIMAPQGTAVKAAGDGTIVKLFNSRRGGITVYQADSSGRFLFYYAHLEHYAAGLAEGNRVRQGEVLGYVGQTGNAPVPHLHFEIQAQDAARRWWRGAAINPYPLLRAGSLEAMQADADAAPLRARMP